MSKPDPFSEDDGRYMELAFRLARRGYGRTSPNPMVGAVLVKNGKIIGQGWHHRAGQPHAEVEALRSATENPRGATLYVTLEPCSTHGRTPPCTDAIGAAGIKRLVVAATDPNPAHSGNGLKTLRTLMSVQKGLMAEREWDLNAAFRHWIVQRTPYVTVKAAMSLDGKIATTTGQSKWITGPRSRAFGMNLRVGSDAILVGVSTIVKDNPSLTVRKKGFEKKVMHRIVLDPTARIPRRAKVLTDEFASMTTIVVTQAAAKMRIAALPKQVNILKAPARDGKIDLRWLLRILGKEQITSLLVEGGGETNGSFLLQNLAHRVACFYAPLVIGGRSAPKGVAGDGRRSVGDRLQLHEPRWQRSGEDILLTARTAPLAENCH